MAQAVTVYRWDEPGAPQLPNGKPSEIIDILTKCLVDGYGDKTPLGWTRPFYDAGTQAVAFRNSVADGGSGGYAKIFSNDGSDNNNALMRITHAASMTDINTVFRQGYTQAFQAQSGTSTTKMDKWALIGTSTAFYFLISRNTQLLWGSNYNATMFVGDFYSIVPNDAGRFITVAAPQNNNSASVGSSQTLDYLTSASSISSESMFIYDADGFDLGNAHAFNTFNASLGAGLTMAADDRAPYAEILLPAMIHPDSQLPSNSPSYVDRLGGYRDYSDLSPTFRGVLPGFFINLFAGFHAATWPRIVTLSDSDYWILRGGQGSSAARGYLKLGTWHDPFNPV